MDPDLDQLSIRDVRRRNGMLLLSTMQQLGEPTTMHQLVEHVAASTPELPADSVRTEVQRFLRAGNSNGFIERNESDGKYALRFDATTAATAAATTGASTRAAASTAPAKRRASGRRRRRPANRAGSNANLSEETGAEPAATSMRRRRPAARRGRVTQAKSRATRARRAPARPRRRLRQSRRPANKK